jgi:hypothetical protein
VKQALPAVARSKCHAGQGAGVPGKRQRNRLTNVEWERKIMGPKRAGQGGCPSDRIYRLVNNEELDEA